MIPMDAEEKNAKEAEWMAFLETESARLRMNLPPPAAVRETIDFLAENNPNWHTETSPVDFARILKQRYPELRFEWADAAVTNLEEAADEPATEKQIAYLKVLEVPIPDYLGIREASDLIDQHKNRVSEAQKRRLDFYKLTYASSITREQANELIDGYKAQHPESEAAYQEWKASQHII
jgi:hypothetical protein